MFEHFNRPDELFTYRLAATLTMEHDSLEMLGELQNAAQSEDIKRMLAHHAQETRHQIGNLEQIFTLLNIQPYDEPSPTTKGLSREGKALIRKTEEALVDNVVLSAALEAEHYEIAVYQTLLAATDVMANQEIASLLHENLAQEQHTSEELIAAAKRVAATKVI